MKFSQALIFMACVPISLVSAMMGFASTSNPYAQRNIVEQFERQRAKPGSKHDVADVPLDPANDEMSCKLTVKLSPKSPESTGATEAETTEDLSKCRTLTLKCSKATMDVLGCFVSGALSGVVKGATLPGVVFAYLCYKGYVTCETIEERCNKDPQAETDEDAVDESAIEPDEQNKISQWLECIDESVHDCCKWTCRHALRGMLNCLDGTFHPKRSRLIHCFPTLWYKLKDIEKEGIKKSFDQALNFKPEDACLEKAGKSLACFTKPMCQALNYFCCCCRAVRRKDADEDDDGSGIDGEDAVEIIDGVMACVVSCK